MFQYKSNLFQEKRSNSIIIKEKVIQNWKRFALGYKKTIVNKW